MRGDKLGSPAFSTYAVGGETRPRRGATDRPLGGSFALPAIVILGTVSAVAIVSISFEGETASVSRQQAGRDDDVSGSYSNERSASPAIDLTDTLLAAERARDAESPAPPAAAPAERPALPYLGVLQSNPIEPAARPRPEVRVGRTERPASLPRHPQPRAEEPAGLAAAGCATDCPPGEAREPSAELARAAPEPQPGLVEATSSVADAGVGPQDLTNGVALVEPVADPLAADAQGEPGVLADAGPPVLAEPSGELIAAAAPAIDAAPAVEPTPAMANPPAAESPGDRDQVALSSEPSVAPVAAAPSGLAENAPAATIPQHLARIEERYSAAPSPAPPAEEPALVEQTPPAGPAAVRLGASDSAAALGVADATGSSVIVQEDELVAIRLGDLVSLFEDRFDHPLYVWMKSSAAASKFVTVETLAAAGIRAHYDAERKQIVFSTE